MPTGFFMSRSYESVDDLQQMQDLLMQGRSRTGDWCYPHVGDLIWAFLIVSSHLNPREQIRLWHDGEGRLAGYAILGEDPSIDWQVLPDYERSGIETEAMAWAERQMAGLRDRDADRWRAALRSGARRDDDQRIAFLERHGFRRGGYVEVNMLRSLEEPIPDAAVPAEFQLRAVAADEQAADRAAAEREVWHPWPDGNVSEDDYRRLMRLPGYDRDLDLVAVAPDGAVAAYANCWIDPINRIGDFGPVGARATYRRQGLTRAVLLEGFRRMKAHRMDRACVSTGEANTPARRLYESVGFGVVNKHLEFVQPAVT